MHMLLVLCVLVWTAGQVSGINIGHGQVEADTMLNTASSNVIYHGSLMMSSRSVLRCGAYCMEKSAVGWVCNLMPDTQSGGYRCEAATATGGNIHTSDILTQSGSVMLADRTLTRMSGITLRIICDDVVNAWADGVQVVTNYKRPVPPTPLKPTVTSIPSSTVVLAVECTNDETNSDSQFAGGILAELSTGVKSDLTWKCEYPKMSTISPSWKNAGFDDSSWGVVKSTSNTGLDLWAQIPSISNTTKWIWGAGIFSYFKNFYPSKSHVYCRKTL